MSQTTLHLYIADAVMLLSAVLAAASTLFEIRRRLVKRWRLLLPGFVAAVSTIVLLAYPQLEDLFQIQLWSVAAVALLLGAARGAFLPMFSDHNYGYVRVRRTIDAVGFGIALVLFAATQTFIEVRAGAESHLEPTMEFLMTVVAGFLLGRSVAAWLRAGMIQHDDLYEPQS